MLVSAYGLALLLLTGFGLHLLVLAVAAASRHRLVEGHVPSHSQNPPGGQSTPNVTVQVPLFNEKYVAARVLDACARLEYPPDRFEIQVLDDSTDETSGIVAERCAYWRRRGIDISHIRRRVREGFKAGALKNGLKTAKGELIAVFDADFRPSTDFLVRLVPCFGDAGVGMIQARWGHLNGGASLLTRTQALGLDTHFAVEQRGRSVIGCYFNFNGTAGIWRRTCIEDAGGWSSDTLTEDLDLSYRAQMRGWRFLLDEETEVQAELPDDMNALRSQQFRWTKGAIETARKNLGPLWRSNAAMSTKIAGTLHLLGNLSYVFMLAAAILHAPLIASAFNAQNLNRPFFAFLSVGLVGLAGIVLAHTVSCLRLYPDFAKRTAHLPWYVAGMIGLCLSNTIAVVQALAGVRTPFLRTPKMSGIKMGSAKEYLARRPAVIPGAEILIGLYCALGAAYLILIGAFVAVPFQVVFAAGFLIIGGASVYGRFGKLSEEEPVQSGGTNATTSLNYVP